MFLLDTNALIWTLSDPEKLSNPAKDVITNSENKLFISIASLWEITIKQSIGKLDLEGDVLDIVEECEREGINILSIQPQHLKKLEQLPLIHRDPFDRLIISQAIYEGLTIITRDSMIPKYDIGVLW
jgi:PIN domain nuclease of toxin-antitoxin system